MKKIKHSKYRNTGFLFELLTRQITYEILNNSKEENARDIVKEFFGGNTQLSKELRLFNLILNEKYNSESKAEKFIDAIVATRTKLDEKKLTREKYNLVKTIKERFDIAQFLSSPITNYKLLASVHKLFESKANNVSNVKDLFDCKYTLVEHISTTAKPSIVVKKDIVFEEYRKQEKDLRLLTYKILVESFNTKYGNLNTNQRGLLREYINNVNNTSNFSDYYKKALKETITELHGFYTHMCDAVTKIKLKETINVMKKQRVGKKISDDQVSALMLSYELIKEIRNVKAKHTK